MSLISELLLIMLMAILVENFIFSRFLGCCPFLGVSDNPSTALGMGCAVMFVMTLSNAATFAVYKFILIPFGLEYLQTVAFILVIACLVQFIEMLLKKMIPALYTALGIYLPLITTNCAVLGAALLNITNGYAEADYGFAKAVVFGFSAAAGFTLAILIFAGVREKMKFSDPPKAFRGTPIVLIAAGLVAMAFSGFSGTKFG